MAESTEMPLAGDQIVAAGTRRLEAMIAEYVGATIGGATSVPGLSVARLTSKGVPTSYLYEPSLCIVARGAKRVELGGMSYRYGEGTCLLTAVGLPTVAQVERASEAEPYA